MFPPLPQWSVSHYARLSIATAIATIVLKGYGYLLTNSLALLADALESLVNLVAVVFTAWMLWLAAQPPDAEHTFGYSKFEYFASGFEGILILTAAGSIIFSALERWLNPQTIAEPLLGTIFVTTATLLNGIVGLLLIRAGTNLNAIALRADGYHLLTDVWTSLGALVGLILVALTGITLFDVLAALVVSLNIIWTGVHLIKESEAGLVDTALPKDQQQIVTEVLRQYEAKGIQFHAFRSRRAGRRSFIQIHVLVPKDWTVQAGHDLCDRLERDIRAVLPSTHIITHLEPLEDELSWQDTDLP
ncbi:MAG: cation diffusion facilitator family transporter [Pseudanabaenaceae cyanobacterium]